MRENLGRDLRSVEANRRFFGTTQIEQSTDRVFEQVRRARIAGADAQYAMVRQHFGESKKLSLGEMAPGTGVYLPQKDGGEREFIVLGRNTTNYIGLDDSAVFLIQATIHERMRFAPQGDFYYEDTEILEWLNNEWIEILDPKLYEQVIMATIPVDDRERLVSSFIPSVQELGVLAANNIAPLGQRISHWTTAQERIAVDNTGTPVQWWLRNQNTNNRGQAAIVTETGAISSRSIGNSCGVRPVIILPADYMGG